MRRDKKDCSGKQETASKKHFENPTLQMSRTVNIDNSILKYVDQADEVWHAGDIGDSERYR
jgi:hypothetical protein